MTDIVLPIYLSIYHQGLFVCRNTSQVRLRHLSINFITDYTELSKNNTVRHYQCPPGSLQWSAAEKSSASIAYFSMSLSQSVRLTAALMLPLTDSEVADVASRIVRSTTSAQST